MNLYIFVNASFVIERLLLSIEILLITLYENKKHNYRVVEIILIFS